VAVSVIEWVEPGAVVDPPAVLVHGTLSWGTLTFDRQRPLAARRRLLVPDRRGFGDSPDLSGSPYTSDYEVDARDVVDLLAAGAHLVGHSYGAVVAMLAAASRPELVRSLALIEPPAHMLAIDDTTVAAAVAAAVAFMGQMRRRPVEDYLRTVFDDIGAVRPTPPDRLHRAAASALGERPCWLAEIPVQPLASAAFATIVLVGARDATAPPASSFDRVLPLVAAAVAEQTGAELVTVPGARHDVQRDQPERTNTLLSRLWSAGDVTLRT
jgi:pimeloyl-ACP methyl ester carboxylesterase